MTGRMRMRELALLLTAAVLLSSAATAQQTQELTPAPNAPNQQRETGVSGNSAGKPANVCQELVAYFKSKQAAGGRASTAAPNVADKPQQDSGQSGTIPNQSRGQGSDQLTPEQAQALADANDLRACQQAAQKMRRAGVALAGGLLALAALREDLLMRATQP
jgi:hypothetical protein